MTQNIKIRSNRDVIISKMTIVTVIIVALLTVFSCRSTDVEGVINPSGQVAVNVSIEDAVFEQTSSIGNKASANKSASPAVQTSTVAFNKDFDLVAELTEEAPVVAQKGVKASLQHGNKAAQTTELKSNINYKIVVFKSTGEYVTDKIYIRGQEASASPLMLNGGNYTFVAYSINSTTNLPDLKFSDVANKTLTNSSIAANGTQDLMYFRKDMTISASGNNYLGVVLKHKFSQITTTIDASETGNIIKVISSSINAQHQPNATLALSDGSIKRSGAATSVEVKFPNIGKNIIIGTPTLINAAANSTSSYIISQLVIGNFIKENFTLFSNLVITPGVKYNMKIKMKPVTGDAYMTVLSYGVRYPVVRISDQMWMRNNLGSTTSSPDEVGSNLQPGSYFQWGLITEVTNGQSYMAQFWNSRNKPNNSAWNSGTEAAPVKTNEDPCPAGFRVPTRTEFATLLSNVNISTVGTTWSAGTANYSSAKILTSKKDSNIKMTLNAQGWFNTVEKTDSPYYTANTIQERGEYGYYWTSSVTSDNNAYFYFFSKNQNPVLNFYASESRGKVVARNIRCIAQYDLLRNSN